MRINRNTHRTFLTENGASEELADHAMRLMEWLFATAKNGSYLLMSKKALEAEGYGPRFAEAIAKATGQEVENVIFVSLEHPFPKPEWMSERYYRTTHRSNHRDNLLISLGDNLLISLRDSLDGSLRVSIGDNLWGSLQDNLRDRVWDSVQDNLRGSFWDSLEDSLQDTLQDNLRNSLWLLNGFALTNDKENFERVAPLLELMVRGLVLSSLKHKPRTWLVFCR